MNTCSCGKKYKNLKSFQEHRALCEMIRLNRTDLAEDIPSTQEMWLAMKALIKKNDRLEKKVTELSSWLNKNKKKLSVIDWLNEKIKPETSYENWLEDIELNEEDLNDIFANDFINGMSSIICKRLVKNGDENTPIRAFEQKQHILYIYNGTKWAPQNNDEFTKMIDSLHIKVQNEFSKYNKKNAEMLKDYNKCEEWYKNIQKIMGTKYDLPTSVKKINIKVYSHLKLNLKNIVEYEFTS
tara:strand:- start:1867 stop:2586 length:720 start_codon:yes stop_codon:yes gene_type:complete